MIPGNFAKERDYSLNACLIRGLVQNATKADVQEVGEVMIDGAKGKQLEVRFRSGETKRIDVYEAFWVDLVKRLSTENPRQKLWRGLNLLIYWTFSKIWMAFRECPNTVLWSIITLILVTLWYYGTMAMGLTAIGMDPTFWGSALPKGWAAELGELGELMGGWSVWVTISTLLAFVKVDLLVDSLDSTQRYLQDAIDETTGESIRTKLRKRVMDTLEAVMACQDYSRVTVISHSFGAMIGVELLAEVGNVGYPLAKPIRYITLGGQLKVLALRSPWVERAIAGCILNPAVEQWIDYYADGDWLCTQTPVRPDAGTKFEAKSIMREVPLWDAVTGKSHSYYFYEKEVIHQILGVESV
ncbi:MAG TPA: hypothetical protein V6C88_15880 [Chroococcidiopsis sp.]